MLTDFLTVTEIAFVVVVVIPALLGLINMLKRVGLPTDFAGPVAVALGIITMMAYAAFGDNRYFVFAMVGLLIGLGTTGFYDLSKMVGSTVIPPAEITVDQSFLPAEAEPGVLADNEPFLQDATSIPTWDQDGPTGQSIP